MQQILGFASIHLSQKIWNNPSRPPHGTYKKWELIENNAYVMEGNRMVSCRSLFSLKGRTIT